MARRSARFASRHVPGVVRRMPGVLEPMPRRSIGSNTCCMPGVLEPMRRRSARSAARRVPGVLERMPGELRHMPGGSDGSSARPMPRRSALGRDQAACPPNMALQLTAARARSLGFKRHLPARSRQLNATPFGGSHSPLHPVITGFEAQTFILSYSHEWRGLCDEHRFMVC